MTPCEKLGYKVRDRFEAGEDSLFSDGSVVELFHDDGSELPLWKLVTGYCRFKNADGEAGAYDSVRHFTKIKRQTQESNMTNITLKPGDYVSIEGVSPTVQSKIADKFIEAGAKKGGGYPYLENLSDWKYMLWDEYDGMTNRAEVVSDGMGRHLTIAQVLGTGGDQQTVQDLLAKADKHARKAAKHEAKRQECIDKARELMPEGWGIDDDRKRIRLGDEPKEDMSDPANWREGDVLEVVDTDHGDGVAKGDLVIHADSDGDFVPYCTKPNGRTRAFVASRQLRFHHRPT